MRFKFNGDATWRPIHRGQIEFLSSSRLGLDRSIERTWAAESVSSSITSLPPARTGFDFIGSMLIRPSESFGFPRRHQLMLGVAADGCVHSELGGSSSIPSGRRVVEDWVPTR